MNATSAQTQAEASLLQDLVDTMPQTLGACLIGTYLSAVFYGVTLLQTYQYFSRYYGRDNKFLYTLVTVLTLLDTFTVILNMNSIWYYLIQNFANPAAILKIDWSFTFSVLTTAIVAFLVQSFYAYRAYILGGQNKWVPLVIIGFGFSSIVLTTVYMTLLFKNSALLLVPKITPLSTANLLCTFCADTTVFVSITIYLLRGKQKGVKKSDTLIRKLVIYTVNTGVITTTCTVIAIILTQALSKTFYNTIFYFPLSKCYINSMLAFLNTRDFLRTNGGNLVSFNPNTLDRTTPSLKFNNNVVVEISRNQPQDDYVSYVNSVSTTTVLDCESLKEASVGRNAIVDEIHLDDKTNV